MKLRLTSLLKNYSELDWLYIIIHKKLLKNMQKSRCEIIVYQTKYNYNIPRPCIYAKWVKINASGKIQHRNYFKEVEWKWYTWISILSKWPLLIIWDDSFIGALGQFSIHKRGLAKCPFTKKVLFCKKKIKNLSNIVPLTFMYTLELLAQDASLFRHPY